MKDALVLRAAHAYQSANPLTDRRPSLARLTLPPFDDRVEWSPFPGPGDYVPGRLGARFLLRLNGVVRGVRGQDDIWIVQQRVASQRRLLGKDVERGPGQRSLLHVSRVPGMAKTEDALRTPPYRRTRRTRAPLTLTPRSPPLSPWSRQRVEGRAPEVALSSQYQGELVYCGPVVASPTKREGWVPRIESETKSATVSPMVPVSPRMRPGPRARATGGCARSWSTPRRS